MNSPSNEIISEFAAFFAQKGKGKGMTNEEIKLYFRKYSNNVPSKELFETSTKAEYFHHCIVRLHVEDQWMALADLCEIEHDFENPLPSEEYRKEILSKLVSNGEQNGLTIRAISISDWEIKREWIKAISRIEKSPDASITASRSLLEKVCKTILGLLNQPTKEGDLGKIVKLTRKALDVTHSSDQVCGGINSIIYGIANTSNNAGDRHGVVDPKNIPLIEAKLVCDLCMSLSLFFLDTFKLQEIQEISTKP